jgi:hypothetical protein
MRTVAWSIVALICCVSFSLDANAQRRRLEALDTRVGNLATDLEVLQEYIQEQSTGLTNIKKKMAELDKLKTQVGKVEGRVNGLSSIVTKNTAAIDTLGQKLAEEEKKVTAIEEELARKRVNFSGQLRIRPEFRNAHKYFNYDLDADENLLASHRARINLDIAPAKWFNARVSLQDARQWGSSTLFLQRDDLGPTTDVTGTPIARPEDANRDSALRVHEAYLDVRAADDLIAVRAGRQIWNFGAGRMVGDNDWEQAGRSFDGLDVTIKYENYVKADLLFSWVDERNSLGGNDVLFGGAYINVPYIEGMDLDAYLLYLGDDRNSAKRNVGTVGARVAGELPMHKALFFDLEGALQFGTVTEQGPTDNATKDNSLYAVFFHADAGYVIPVETSPTISLFYELASGDGNTSPADEANDQAVSWIPLFPTSHSLFGRMDIWRQTNVWDVGGRIKVTPVKGLDVTAELHSLHLYESTGAFPWGGEPAASYLEEVDTTLGLEFDLFARYVLSEQLALTAGYSVFAPGGAFSDLDENDPIILEDSEDGGLYRYPRGDAAQWLYVQADFTF